MGAALFAWLLALALPPAEFNPATTRLDSVRLGEAMCSVYRRTPKHPDDPVKDMVRTADAIVRARAVRKATPSEMDSAGLKFIPGVRIPPPEGAVVFDVLEVIKGQNVHNPLVIGGALTDHDDFNDGPVPYLGVRMEGRTGFCFASTYRQGGEFLLMLFRDQVGRLGPSSRYYPLMPLNEQLHGPEDPWVAWVRAQVKRRR